MIAYSAHNRVTGKRYIGITSMSVRKRWTHHVWRARRGVGTVLYAAIRKHGPAAFEVSEIAVLLPSASTEELRDLEKELIRQEGTRLPTGYNMTSGGDGTFGYQHSKKTRDQMRNRRHSEETRRKMSESRKGKRPNLTAEQRRQRGQKVSAANKGRKRSEEFCRHMRITRKGKPHGPMSPQQRVLLSSLWTPEKRAARSEFQKQRIRDGIVPGPPHR